MNNLQIIRGDLRGVKVRSAWAVLCLALVLTAACRRDQTPNVEPAKETSSRDQTPNVEPAKETSSMVVRTPIQDMSCVGADSAWVVTVDGRLLHTKDGGESWAPMSSAGVKYFVHATFINAKQGFALNHRYRIWRTTDSGVSWQRGSRLGFIVDEISFSDALHGWAIDPWQVAITEDGGATWRRTHPSTRPDTNIYSFHLAKQGTGWLGRSDGLICKSSDGGLKWRQQKVGDGIGGISEVFFLNTNTGWLVASPPSSEGRGGATIYRTSDGGETWDPEETLGGATYLPIVHFVTPEEGWAVGSEDQENAQGDPTRGVILHTTDGGKNWQTIHHNDHTANFLRAYFADSRIGWLTDEDKVYRTTDGGRTLRVSLDLSLLSSSGSARVARDKTPHTSPPSAITE